jgi:hypothetical protein
MTVNTSSPRELGVAPPQPRVGLPQALARALAGLRAWWRWQNMDALTRYLAKSSDHRDFERRVRQWDEQRLRRLPWPP